MYEPSVQTERLTTMFTISTAVFIICIHLTITAAAINKTENTKGVCEFEVPIASILPPELKHTAASIKGNGTNPGLSKIKICCVGYKLANHTAFHCIPDCPNGCGVGNCTAPNTCECEKDAIKAPDGKCILTCPKGCLNGQCYNKYCNCNRGYILEPSGRFCIPGCTKVCGIGGVCAGYDQCKCDTGYHLNKEGTCSVFCKDGYRQVGEVCEPVCSKDCHNGVCTAPNVCTCNPGWVKDANGIDCKPHCPTPCLNGICTAPNLCSCKQGYVKDPSDAKGNRCVAHCPQGCPNGSCTAPNFCICNAGFVKQAKGSNVCVKK